MLLYQSGDLPLDTKLAALFGPSFVAADLRKANVTVQHLLTHSAGLPPDPTDPGSYCTPKFACPETRDVPAPRRSATFSCQSKVLSAVNAQPLARPPGEKYVYSDLSMITLMFAIGRTARVTGAVSARAL